MTWGSVRDVGWSRRGTWRGTRWAGSLWLLVEGGLTYVAGVGFYVWERLRFQNAIWHGFVAVAAGLHFAAVAVAVS